MAKKKMPEEVYAKLFQLRCRAKRGEYMTNEEFDFLNDCYKKYPKEYKAMTNDIFVATKPFGSQI